MRNEIKYAIQHTYKREVIIPVAALYHNLEFLTSKEDEKLIKTSDGFICKVKRYDQIHICQLEQDIQRLYNMDTWSYIKKWYSAMPYIDSMYFLKMDLEKYELQ